MSHSNLLKYLQRFFRVIDKIAPFLSISLAKRLFITPFKFPRSPWEKAALGTARVSRREWKEVEYQPAKDACYYIYEWGQDGPPVLLLHGWSGRGSQMGFIAKALADAGFRAIAFDAPAHGKSTGKRTNILEITRITLDLQKTYGEFAAVIGHSFGGVVGAFAMHRGLAAKQLVTIGSPATLDYVVDSFAELIRVSPRTAEKLKLYVEKRSGLPRHHFALTWLITQLGVPVLAFHDKNDQEVRVSQIYQLQNAWPQGEYHLTEGLGHYKILRDEGVRQKILSRLETGVETSKPVSEQA